jgi:hypothetical protein
MSEMGFEPTVLVLDSIAPWHLKHLLFSESHLAAFNCFVRVPLYIIYFQLCTARVDAV